MKHPTTSQLNVAKTSQWYVFTTSCLHVVTTCQGNVMTTSHQYVSTTSQISLKSSTQRRLSGMSPRRHIHDVPLVDLYDVSCNSQRKHPITSLWYVSTTPRSYFVATHCLYYGLYYVFKLLSRDLYNQTLHFSSTNQEGNKRISLDYKLMELLLHLKDCQHQQYL